MVEPIVELFVNREFSVNRILLEFSVICTHIRF
jgi:hypothetical protein